MMEGKYFITGMGILSITFIECVALIKGQTDLITISAIVGAVSALASGAGAYVVGTKTANNNNGEKNA